MDGWKASQKMDDEMDEWKASQKKITTSFNICNVIISYVHEMLLSSASIDRI